MNSDGFRRCEVCGNDYNVQNTLAPVLHGACASYHRNEWGATVLLQSAIMIVIAEVGGGNVEFMIVTPVLYFAAVAHAVEMVRQGLPASMFFDGWRYIVLGIVFNFFAYVLTSPTTTVVVSAAMMQRALQTNLYRLFSFMEVNRIRVVERRTLSCETTNRGVLI